MDEDISKLDELILNGGVEVSGLTDSGQFLYKFTDKLQDIDADLYNAIRQKMYEEIMFLWQKGFISMDITVNNPIVRLTEKAFDKDEVDNLPEDIKANLLAFIRSMSEHS
jgi:hypothetical protein